MIESDLSGETGASHVRFGYEDVWYEIDLTDEERQTLADALNPYIASARRKTAVRRPARRLAVPDTTVEERKEIRAWGRDNGLDVPERGFIPRALYEAYQEAHSAKPTSADKKPARR